MTNSGSCSPFGPNVRECGWLSYRYLADCALPVGFEGEEWKRNRRIIQPAFNKETYKHVWEESYRLFGEMSEQEGWDYRNEILLEPVDPLTSRVHCIPLFLERLI